MLEEKKCQSFSRLPNFEFRSQIATLYYCRALEYLRNIPWNIEVRVFSSRFPGFSLADHVIGGILWNIVEYCRIWWNDLLREARPHLVTNMFWSETLFRNMNIVEYPMESSILDVVCYFETPYKFRYSTIFRNIPLYSMEYQYSAEI